VKESLRRGCCYVNLPANVILDRVGIIKGIAEWMYCWLEAVVVSMLLRGS
jgi:hypothetical protein